MRLETKCILTERYAIPQSLTYSTRDDKTEDLEGGERCHWWDGSVVLKDVYVPSFATFLFRVSFLERLIGYPW